MTNRAQSDALVDSLRVITQRRVVNNLRRDRILAVLHRQFRFSFRQLAEIVGRNPTTVREWVMRVPEDDVALTDEVDCRRVSVAETIAHIQSLGSHYVLPDQELRTFLTEVMRTSLDVRHKGDGPPGWDMELETLRDSLTEALKDRTSLRPTKLAVAYRQGLYFRQWRLSTYGVDRFAELRQRWLDWLANLICEAVAAHPTDVDHWVRTGLVSREESVEISDWLDGKLEGLTAAEVPFNLVLPIVTAVRIAAHNRGALSMGDVDAALACLGSCKDWLTENIGTCKQENFDRLYDYLTRLGEEIRGRQNPAQLVISYTEAIEILEWANDQTAAFPEGLAPPWEVTGPAMLVLQRAVDNRASLTALDIDAAKVAVERGVAWWTDTPVVEVDHEAYDRVMSYLNRLETEITRRNLPPPPEVAETA